MGKIILLPKEVINRIAAGEVVERPANVVKELVENSIDANASKIIVEVKNAGKSLIKVDDNGSGMSRDDAKLSVEKHATSKIRDIDDIYKTLTYGFRGEALASISSVSKFELITSDGKECTKIVIENDEKRIEECSRARGTTIIVKDLFYNVPVRKKYLKSKNVELKHIVDVIIKYAIVHPEISFKLISDKKVIINAPSVKSLKDKIVLLFGLNYAKNSFEINYKEQEIEVKGFIGNKNLTRKTKTDFYIFVNKRPIKSDVIEKAILEGYGNYLAKNEYPFVVLNVNLPTDWIDVNVHPKKETINFFEPEKVFAVVFSAIKLKLTEKEELKFYQFQKRESMHEQKKLFSSLEERKNESKNEKFEENIDNLDPRLREILQDIKKNKPEIKAKEKIESEKNVSDIRWPEFLELNYLGQFALTYLIFEKNNELWIFDQHLVEERYNYERLKKKINKQSLLKPIILKPNKKDYFALKESLEILNKVGFEIDEMKDYFAVRTIPDVLNKFSNEEREKIIKEIIDEFIELKRSVAIDKLLDETIATIACKASVKAGTRLDPYRVKIMIANLAKCDHPYTCPHGRPVIVKINKYELDRMFQRK